MSLALLFHLNPFRFSLRSFFLLHGKGATVQQKNDRKLNRKGLKWNSDANDIGDINSNTRNNIP